MTKTTANAKPTIRQMEIAHKMFCHWSSSADALLKEKWYKCHLVFWTRNETPMASIRWAPFDLDVCSFSIPDQIPEPERIDEWPSQQNLKLGSIEDGQPPIMSEKQAPESETATIPEIVDAFLEGSWTPYWHCATCRKRFNGNMKPI